MPTFTIRTLGCKVNQFESEAMAGMLSAAGWKQVADGPADLYIVNTCAVTGKSAGQSRQYLRHYRRENPRAVIIATGCYATVAKGDLENMDCVDCIVGHAAKYKIPAMASRLLQRPADDLPRSVEDGLAGEMFACFSTMPVQGSRTRPVMKIQDGCNAFCAYCIVPYARGRSASMPPDQVIAGIKQFSAAGFHEVVLTGIHLGAWGLDLTPPQSFYRLLEAIDTAAVIERVRLSSIEPGEISDEIIDLAARSRHICHHFHIPLQSGCDEILSRMGRPYTAAFFKDRVEKIKAGLPDAAVGADVLVGFPGENDRAFERTLTLLDSIPVGYLHVFPFSPRPGTPAAGFPDPVRPAIIRERCRRLRRLGDAKRAAFCRGQRQQTCLVRIEDKRDRTTGRLKGVTSNYLTVLVEGDDALMNRDVIVRIGEQIEGLRVRGEIVY